MVLCSHGFEEEFALKPANLLRAGPGPPPKRQRGPVIDLTED